MAAATTRVDRRAEGLASARAWREQNRPKFDAIYGPERCPTCGQPHGCGRG